MKKINFVFTLTIIFLVLYIVFLQYKLENYNTLPKLSGTYQSEGEPNDMEVLVFQSEGENYSFWYYKQTEFKVEGKYCDTECPNLYVLEVNNTENMMVFVQQDGVYLLKANQIVTFDKVSDQLIFIE